MKQDLQVILNEQDVELAIKEYVEKHQGLKVKKIKMRTSVRGDFDRGNAVQYVEKVWCKCN